MYGKVFMKKGENIFIVIISLALVACVVMGCVAAFKRIGEIFSEELCIKGLKS